MDWPVAINRLAQGIDHPAKQFFADRDINGSSQEADPVPGMDIRAFAKDNGAGLVGLQVKHHTERTVLEFYKLIEMGPVHPGNQRHAVAVLENRTDLITDGFRLVLVNYFL